MASDRERIFILEMIDGGKITAEEGLHLLQALPEDEDDEAEAPVEALPDELDPIAGKSYEVYETEMDVRVEVPPSQNLPESGGERISAEEAPAEGLALSGEAIPANTPPDFNRWRRFWMIPLWAGVGVTVVGAMLMYQAQMAAGVSFWFFCATVPFALGVILLTLAWQSRTARWLHLRVQHRNEGWPRVFAISFPLPLGLAGWVLRTFGVRVPGMETTSVDELLQVIQTSTSPENPLFVEVEEEGEGEKVQIYIG